MHHNNTAKIICTRANRRSWPAILDLFGANGACGGCWCQYWNISGSKAWEAAKGANNRKALKRELDDRTLYASLARVNKRVVGWCRYGPFHQFPRLCNSRVLNRNPVPATWSILCFFVAREFRDQGVGLALLDHAIEVVKRHGACVVEGYPIALDNYPTQRAPAAFAWTGVPALFRARHFKPLRQPGTQRVVYRLKL